MIMKKIFVFAMACTAACLSISTVLNCTGVCSFCQDDILVFKRKNGDHFKLPNVDCSRAPPFLVILVTSHPSQFKSRMAIRETWGKERVVADKRIVTYFLLGNTSQPFDQITVTSESLLYKDIIQKDFLDTYYNLTLKTLMGLEWVHRFCPQSSFVMKTDSDMFVNTYYLMELLLKKTRMTRFFTGVLKMHDNPIRDPKSKWCVSKEEYPENKYPPFCSGTGYVLSTDVASQVFIVLGKVRFLKLEDMFVGLCLAELKIKPEMLDSEPTFFADQVEFSPCCYRKLVTSRYISSTEMMVYWNGLEKSMIEECPEVPAGLTGATGLLLFSTATDR
ncbi:beta-1,3-galactosyltransferase 5-like [Eublepharis macularius]|uniref:Hexosyltransferase n=1 Tax=Eublepharis macularius TaxID=481883 RepID=A0AA97KUV2_EUBMA|nr:beta-1,3-galactosyltransferase 5-like [Eublepharis macularius]